MIRLLLVGWDAADWKVIDKLGAKGEMPHLARLPGSGVYGNLATIHPPLSPCSHDNGARRQSERRRA